MKTFRTEIQAEISSFRLAHSDKTMVIGSCFSEHIGQRLQNAGFNTLVNPFGILYNPISIYNSISRLMNPIPFTTADLVFEEERWLSYYHHSRFNGYDAESFLLSINNQLIQSQESFRKVNRIIITFGSAIAYKLTNSGVIVSNCHKQAGKNFERLICSLEEEIARYISLFTLLTTYNSNIEILLTVSPVRYIKNNTHENSISKSILLLLCDKLVSSFRQVHYFPAYEFVIDDLRDYRFYEADMIHPNQLAIEYVWNKFSDSCFERETIERIISLHQIWQILNHKPFNPTSAAYQKLINDQTERLKELKLAAPEIDLSAYYLLLNDRQNRISPE